MKLTVTQTDINKGEPNSSCNCPIARALKKALDISLDAQLGDDEYVEVDNDSADVYVFKHGMSVLIRTYPLPTKGAKFIKKFDDLGKKAVKPITLTLKRAKED